MKKEIKYLRFSAPDNWRDNLDEADRWIEFPSFDDVLWPFILENSAAITRIYLFDHRDSKLGALPQKELKDTPLEERGKFKVISQPRTLNESLRKLLSIFSFYPHFNVFYETSEWEFMVRFAEFFPFSSYFDSVDKRMFHEDDVPDFEMIVADLPAETFLFGFAHDADYLAVFGENELLARLMGEHGRYIANSRG